MAKFTQATLNQVAGFDAQVLAQNLIYNQKDFWNFEWSAITSYTSGWQTGTTPVDLTGATIDATIVRRAIVDYQDSRTGIDFKIYDYPLVNLITTVTQITLTGGVYGIFTCTSTAELFVGQPVRFEGSVFSDVALNTTYYVATIISDTTFTITSIQGSTSPEYFSTASGSMRMVRVNPIPISLPISNVDAAEGTFTMTVDDDTWDLIAGDPDLDISAAEPACFTGRIKISFPAVGTQPAYDQAVFLLFLVNSDGVINY